MATEHNAPASCSVQKSLTVTNAVREPAETRGHLNVFPPSLCSSHLRTRVLLSAASLGACHTYSTQPHGGKAPVFLDISGMGGGGAHRMFQIQVNTSTHELSRSEKFVFMNIARTNESRSEREVPRSHPSSVTMHGATPPLPHTSSWFVA
jgi:hypothetical protein